MRIGMLVDVYKPHVSGVTHHISLTKKTIESSGHEVFIFTFGDLDYPDDEPNIHRSPGVPLADTGYYLNFGYSSAVRAVVRTMDLLHVHHPFLSGRLALRYGRPAKLPIVFTNHTRYDLYAQAYLPMLPDQIGASFLSAYLPTFCREVDLVIAPSEGLRRVLYDLGVRSPIEVVPNGVDLTRFRADVTPVARASLGIPEEDVLLIFSGRLGPEKNLHFLLRAFAGVQAAFPRTSLLLVGDGPERDNLEDLAVRSGLQEKIRFTGMVDYLQVPSYLAAADGFVTTSVTEVHPLSVIEALAAGLPVVGIQSPGVGDTITDGHDGLLSANDLAAYSAKLTRFLVQGDLRAQMAAVAPATAEKYAIERTGPILEAQYERLVRGPRKIRHRVWQRLWQRVGGFPN